MKPVLNFRRPTKKWFTVVEMEVNSRCNRKCHYCPVSRFPPPEVPEFMSGEVFHKIIKALAGMNYSGRLSYHLYSEPLLRSDLEKLTKIVRDTVPRCYQVLFTNGILLTEKRYKSLINAGINHFIVTVHDCNEYPQRSSQSILYPSDLILNNRGGTLSDLEKPLSIPCFAPSEMLIITVTGDVILCCNDAQRKNIMGNVMEKSLEEIWFSPRFMEIRELLEKGNRGKATGICKICNDIESYASGSAAQYIRDVISNN
jgi:cyclic pyranopterin phosphate synthase